MVVGDENPVRIGNEWRTQVAGKLEVPFHVVDADVVVPTSLFPKEEFAVRTLRPKIHRVLTEYLKPLPSPAARIAWAASRPGGESIHPDELMRKLKVGGVPEVPGYRGGAAEARRRLSRFVLERLIHYARDRNEPRPYATTELSAHLHFGHISPLTIALEALKHEPTGPNVDTLLEELIVRRELAINFVARNPDHDSLSGCPAWARETLAKHAIDPRPVLYTATELEAGRDA